MGNAKQVLPPSQGAHVLESCGVQAAPARRAVLLPPGGRQDLREEDGRPLLAGPPSTGKTALAPGMLGEGVRHRVMAPFPASLRSPWPGAVRRHGVIEQRATEPMCWPPPSSAYGVAATGRTCSRH
jgi:hypothetical protein